MKKKHILLCITALLTLSSFAQKAKPRAKSSLHTQIESKTNKYLAALQNLITQYNTNWTYEADDTLSNPYYYPLLITPTLYTAPLQQTFGLQANDTMLSDAAYDKDLLRNKSINAALAQIYITAPQAIAHTEQAFRSESSLLNVDKSVVGTTVKLTDIAKPKPTANTILPTETPEIIAQKPNFWTFSGNYSLQFMQNYVSNNWYKGGESNYSTLASVVFRANYNNKQKVVFDNVLEMKIGFRSSESDTINKFKTNTDLIRMTNKLGLRATNKWYYTVMLQSWTQFYKGYKTNRKTPISDFMSPFQTVFSVGMNYKHEKKKLKLSVDISPLALNFIYVDRLSLAPNFGVDQGKHTNLDFGSTLTATMYWNIANNVAWQSRLYGFTSYHKAQIEWENTIHFTINKYLSSKLFLYPRFDDSAKRQPGKSYLQFNEWLSLGLDVNF